MHKLWKRSPEEKGGPDLSVHFPWIILKLIVLAEGPEEKNSVQ